MDQPIVTPPTEQQLTLLESLGTPAFFDHFLNWLQHQLLSDQCMIFFCPDGEHVSTLLYKDFSHDASARQLAMAYISERQYLHDPNFDKLRHCQPDQLITEHYGVLSGNMGLHYRNRFFEQPGFLDKWSVICHSDSGNYYINLYSRRGYFRPLFNNSQQQEQGIARLLALLVSKHYLLNNQLLDQGPLAFLSERERQVCEAVLAGKKSETIAHDLTIAPSSVVTYKKRAYDKLGICSRAQLFALCR
ncbi:helix-turn-helix transcriptional regulator [Oceanobacter antarcticus]|uniref:Helix-turn-helix transcriptional regulator n=1 Tax=Oceanobacter antarcticus TaxID=3133425 RepID=A0ABW8NJN0_9GAMM